jgi:hypothetical protein
MKKHTELNTKNNQTQHNATIAMTPRRAAPDWKPQPCGLSREELRKIVEEILG